MKTSKYNYIVKDGDQTLFFNGITESSFKINTKNRESYEMILNNPDANYQNFGKFIDKLKDKGFILDDEKLEDELLKQKYDAIRNPRQYQIMILPTYQCNLRCWYCVQNHKDLWLSDEDVKRIKSRIKNVLENNDEIENLHISWFGGEPLLAYDRIVEISEWAIELCESLGKTYTAAITTNGTLLTQERIAKLHELKIIHYQITIDGDRVTHNKIKVLGKSSAFDIALKNIGEIIKHTHCLLRFNYTKENLKPEAIIEDVKSVLPEEGRDNVQFLIYKVWQENEEGIDDKEVQKLSEMAEEIGLDPRLAPIGMCYADHKYFDCVFANGKIGKCDNADPDSSHANGIIREDGGIDWESKNFSLLSIFDSEAKAEDCTSCRFLPVCWGPCPIKREYMLKKYGKVVCQYSDREREVPQSLLNTHFNSEHVAARKC